MNREPCNIEDPPQSEMTEIGEQFLAPGCRAITQRERLEMMMQHPSQPRRAKRQKTCDIGLFDMVSRNQMEFFEPKPVKKLDWRLCQTWATPNALQNYYFRFLGSCQSVIPKTA